MWVNLMESKTDLIMSLTAGNRRIKIASKLEKWKC